MTSWVLVFKENDPHSVTKRRAIAKGGSYIREAKDSLELTTHLIMKTMCLVLKEKVATSSTARSVDAMTSNYVVYETLSGVNQSPRTRVSVTNDIWQGRLSTAPTN